MEKFSAEIFFGIAALLGGWLDKFSHISNGQPQEIGSLIYDVWQTDRAQLSDELNLLYNHCDRIGLRVSKSHVAELHDILTHQGSINNIELANKLVNIWNTVMYEMGENLFLFIRPERSTYYINPRYGWEDVIRRFPNTEIDIEEASKCFACDRYAGAVFHIMLVAEVGAVEIGKLIQINDPKPGWPATIREMRRISSREKYRDLQPVEQKHRDFIGQLLPLMESIQTAWRNKISHVENRLVLMSGEFSVEIAEEIIISTRGFMRRLALEIPQ